MSNRILKVTVGLPRSGKSTWSRQQAKRTPVVNPDSIRLAFHGMPFIAKAEPWVWQMSHTFVEALFEAGHEEVIIDACFHTKYRRDQWFGPWSREFYVFETPMSVCLERAKATNQEYLIPVIRRMNGEWQDVAPIESDTVIKVKGE